MPLRRHPHVGQRIGGKQQRLDGDELVRLAMDEQDGGRGILRRALRSGRRLPQHMNPRIAEDGARRRAAAQARVEGHHRTLAEAHESERSLVESAPGELLVQKGVERRAGGVDAAPALVRVAREQREPLSPHRRHRASLGRVGRDEIGVGQKGAPMPADLDQIIAVRAEAVEKDHELSRLAGFRRHPRAVDLNHAECSPPAGPTASDRGALCSTRFVARESARTHENALALGGWRAEVKRGRQAAS